MRMFFAVIVCKILKFFLGIIGRGSSLPGEIALKLYPDVLKKVQLPPLVIAVTGSNGKTSTVEMIAHTMRSAGKTVVWNEKGSNQIAGITCIILSKCTLSGKMKADALLLETDERYAKHSFKHFAPTHYVITNLYRDQLTRNAHHEWVYEDVKKGIREESTLIINADDPLVSLYGFGKENTVWFGMDKQDFSTDKNTGIYDDGKFCPNCKAPMKYDYYHYNHVGSYSCENCGHKKNQTKYTVTKADLDSGIITINDKYDIKLAFKSIYNVYNILAAFTICSIAGIDGDFISKCISNYILKNGRVVQYRLGETKGTFLLSKHENSVSYDRSLEYIVRQKEKCAVIIIVDSISRRYSTGETSWLWDIDFGMLDKYYIKRIYLLGKHAKDLELRFSFTGIDSSKLIVNESIDEGIDAAAKINHGKLYTVTCFSDKHKFLPKVEIIKPEDVKEVE